MSRISSSTQAPFALTDVRVRRLFAQEFTTQLQRVGAASLQAMEETFRVKLFKIAASREELRYAADEARRYGWVSAPNNPAEGEWSLTDSGASLARPTSLASTQVVARILRVISPVREQATNLLPYVALIVGGVVALRDELTTLTATRIIVIAVLAWTFAIQLGGEAQIIRAINSWPRLNQDSDPPVRNLVVMRFYSWFRFALNVVFLVAVLGAFSFGIFNWPGGFAIAALMAFVLGVPILGLSLRATVATWERDTWLTRRLLRGEQ